jgi:hypothetical protein
VAATKKERKKAITAVLVAGTWQNLGNIYIYKISMAKTHAYVQL